MAIVAHAHPFVIGVDTHARTHAIAVLDASTGAVVDSAQFPATKAGMARGIAWAARRTGGDLAASWVIEGIGTYGAQLPGKKALFAMMLGTLMVPAIVTFMPLFVLVSNMGMVNSYPGLILPTLAGASGVAFGGFLMRQYILGLPDDLIDAARVDGASEYGIFFRIILPLCGPALAALGILTFLAAWNNFLWPLVVATTEDMYTLPVAIALFAIGQHETSYGLLLAGSVTVVLPVVIVFIVLQRYFTQGIAMTGLK